MGNELDHFDSEWGSSDPPGQLGYGRAYHGDRFFYSGVAITLALVSQGVLAGSIWLAVPGKEIPQSIVYLGSTAVGVPAGVPIAGKG